MGERPPLSRWYLCNYRLFFRVMVKCRFGQTEELTTAVQMSCGLSSFVWTLVPAPEISQLNLNRFAATGKSLPHQHHYLQSPYCEVSIFCIQKSYLSLLSADLSAHCFLHLHCSVAWKQCLALTRVFRRQLKTIIRNSVVEQSPHWLNDFAIHSHSFFACVVCVCLGGKNGRVQKDFMIELLAARQWRPDHCVGSKTGDQWHSLRSSANNTMSDLLKVISLDTVRLPAISIKSSIQARKSADRTYLPYVVQCGPRWSDGLPVRLSFKKKVFRLKRFRSEG